MLGEQALDVHTGGTVGLPGCSPRAADLRPLGPEPRKYLNNSCDDVQRRLGKTQRIGGDPWVSIVVLGSAFLHRCAGMGVERPR